MTTVVSIQTIDDGYAVKLEDGSREWTVEMSTKAYRTLLKLPHSDNHFLGILDLRDFGFINLTDQGDMDNPLAMSPLGSQVANVIKVGSQMTTAIDDRLSESRNAIHGNERKMRMVGGSFLMVLAIAMFALGYHALKSFTSFITLVIKGGGAPSEAAFGLMVEPTGLLMQFLLVVVVPTVILLLVGARQVRTAIALPK